MSDYQLSRDQYQRRNKYIDLKINGRLFPSFILHNFKRYKLPEIIRAVAKDPCGSSDDIDEGKVRLELRRYQLFLAQYLDFSSPYRDILIYHGLGSGKTSTSINVYNILYNSSSAWNVFLLIKASLKGSWLDELKKWLEKDEYEFRYQNILFIHYDSPFADRNFMDAIKNVDSAKKSLYVIDEAHNFMRNVYSNINSTKGKRAQRIYDYIIQDKRENPDTRVILLSGTPSINSPFELALLFNLLRPGVFPKSENEFNHHFISSTAGYRTINKNNKNLFQRRIMGLVSYYIGATPDLYATKTIQYVDVKMSDYQEDIYNFFEEIEEKLAMKMRLRGLGASTTYKSYTRQAANFVFPPISQRINGEDRPRPSKFRITEREAEKLLEGQDISKSDKDNLTNVAKYKEAMDAYINGMDSDLYSRDSADKTSGHTIMKDLEIFINKYKGNFKEFNEGEKIKSSLYNLMYMCSAKMVNIIFNIMISKGPVLVYSNYVHMEGLQMLKMYLKYFGFYNYMESKELVEGRVGYIEFHGGIKDIAERYRGMKVFNQSNNKYGEFLKIILVSSAGAEGLNLMNVRQIHIMEPYWNEVRINQLIGRGIRQCSHRDLPMEERHVNVYRYKSVKTKTDKWTTDQYIEDVARTKDSLIQSFLDAMKEVAVDCALDKNHNMLAQEYKCFQFDEPTQFDQYPGPSSVENMYDDMKYDNGSNSKNSVTLKIKVMKIRAVKKLSEPEAEFPEYSKSDDYWYYPESRTVYDYELQYPIGKIAVGEDGLPLKLDKDTFVIDYVIPLPNIQE
ncbi:DEAD/SNF2 helicase [uncultured virus]|nr:DEAD/SNF2 helicase [uncultured virus]